MNDVTVLIVDRSEIFRAGIAQKLACQTGIKLLECGGEHDPIKMVDSHNVNVVLLDIDHPGTKGLEVAKNIIRYYPYTRVIIISSYFNDDELFYAINSSLLSKPGVAERILKQFQEMASMEQVTHKPKTPLTLREIQILRFIANGCTNKEVAHRLNISDQTIKNHVSTILRKLNANDRAHAVAMAVYNHWVTLEEEAVLK